MSQFSFKERLRYAFDNTMSKGTIALIGWLAVLSLIIIVVMALIVSLFRLGPAGNEQIGVVEAAWLALMRTLDAGTMGGDEGWGFRIMMLIVTIGGIFVISTLIGVLASGLEAKLDDLRKGRSKVVETGQTVILGWSYQIFPLISELVLANENQPRACIVILGDKDKVEMEDEIRQMVGNTGHTRIVCRTGSPMDMADLEIVSLNTAKSIIILAPEGDNADTQVVKTILAITNNPNRRTEPYHIVAEIQTVQNLEVAKIVGKNEIELVLVGDLIARITAQTCRQSGLSAIYSDLLDFGGDEIYFKEEPALVGKPYGEALFAYRDSAVIGLQPHNSVSMLNPPMDTVIQPGDQIIAVSEDDDTIQLSEAKDIGIDVSAICNGHAEDTVPEKVLLLGWNKRAHIIVSQLDNYVIAGSTLLVVANSAEFAEEIAHCGDSLKNLSVISRQGDTTDRAVLNELPFNTIEHIILVSYSDALSIQEADACTLITLLHLRDIADKLGCKFSIVSEILDVRNRQLAEVTRADDFVVSERLISLMLSQISENKALAPVFTDLFDPEGAEIYLKPAGYYVTPGKPVNFYTVIESARRKGETAIGYRLLAEVGNADKNYGVALNPNKAEMVTFGPNDRIVVLAES